MIKLRDYQQKAVDSIIGDLNQHKKVIGVLATGAGKSLINAELVIRAAKAGLKVLCLCHQQEILEQNEQAIYQLNPNIKVGIYCAGLGRKELDNQVVIASRDSFANCADNDFDLLVVDECQSVPESPKSRYQNILKRVDPKFVIGLTATPWRMTKAIWGDDFYFNKISCNVSISELIELGYLCQYVFPDSSNTLIKAQNIKKSQGDFLISELEKISNNDDVISASVNDWHAQTKDRKLSLFFCVSIAHAKAVKYKVEQLIGSDLVGYLDSNINKKDRKQFFENARNGLYKAIINVATMTTGINIPAIDCIVMLRATSSPALYVQMMGRSLRINEEKKNALFLDYTDNHVRFKSIEEPRFFLQTELLKKKKLKPKDKPVNVKECPSCAIKIQARVTMCNNCGHIFVKHVDVAYVFSASLDIKYYTVSDSHTKLGEECKILNITTDKGVFKKWLLHTRPDWIGSKARADLQQIKLDYAIETITLSKCGKYVNEIYFNKEKKNELNETITEGFRFRS